MKRVTTCLLSLALILTVSAKEYHVSKTGNDTNQGSAENPFLTIQTAANAALAGDRITVHAGIYREWVNPPNGGNADNRRIVFRAAENEKVEIKGSEVIKGWEKLTGTVWKVTLPNSFFGAYNPYKDVISGDWFQPLGRVHHTGEVYLNGKALWEAALLEDVLHPKMQQDKFDAAGSLLTWYCESNDEKTFLYANFQGANPNEELVEINVRRSCFYPENTGINFITVSGFHMSQAATQWAPPTAEQIGLIGTNWSKGWVIENNTLSDSKCSGITLGKYGDRFDNTSQDKAEGYVETIHRAIERGWNKENIGSHRVSNNIIFNCEQTGICGSLGAIFSTIENNNIFNIWTKRQFTGAEIGGIKIHAAIDVVIKNNRLANCGRGLWLDWMAQGTRVTGNLLYNNTTDDLFVEVNHGPYVVDNNLFLSETSLRDWSEGGAFIHNWFAGNMELKPQKRLTPFHPPHSTKLAGLKETQGGDNRFYNNLFTGSFPVQKGRQPGLKTYKNTHYPCYANGNVYHKRAQSFPGEKNFLLFNGKPEIHILEKKDQVFIEFNLDADFSNRNTQTVTTELLGKAKVSGARFENADQTALSIDNDYFGKERAAPHPVPGPFVKWHNGKTSFRVW